MDKPKYIAFFISDEKNNKIYANDALKEYIDFSEFMDLVNQVDMTYEVAWELKRRGVTVVLGGSKHFAEDALQLFDAVAIGNCGELWPRILEDFNNGELKIVYEDSGSNLSATA